MASITPALRAMPASGRACVCMSVCVHAQCRMHSTSGARAGGHGGAHSAGSKSAPRLWPLSTATPCWRAFGGTGRPRAGEKRGEEEEWCRRRMLPASVSAQILKTVSHQTSCCRYTVRHCLLPASLYFSSTSPNGSNFRLSEVYGASSAHAAATCGRLMRRLHPSSTVRRSPLLSRC
jgi:hypothetical protein